MCNIITVLKLHPFEKVFFPKSHYTVIADLKVPTNNILSVIQSLWHNTLGSSLGSVSALGFVWQNY